MLTTEHEAKQKSCPMARNDERDDCLASECMAWRWDDNLKSRGGESSKGFCGLAVKIVE